MSKVTIIGTGYVGLVNGACLTAQGHEVTCVDIDQRKIDLLRKGESPIYEPGLDKLLPKIHDFTTSYDSIPNADFVMIAVGTPPNADGSANLDYIFSAAQRIGETLAKADTHIIVKSTVPVGTTHKVRKIILEETAKRCIDFCGEFAFVPEFLKEGEAINDCLKPDRVVIGSRGEAFYYFAKLFSFNDEARIIWTDVLSAEMIKYASNAMLATRISFANEMANLCEKVGANYDAVKLGMGLDKRIGKSFLNAGCGYGGSCFPKDVKALISVGEKYGSPMTLLETVEDINAAQKHVPFNKLQKSVLINNKYTKIAVLGLAFKPGTDDMREAPSITFIEDCINAGISAENITAFDPIAIDNARQVIPHAIKYTTNPYEAIKDADAIVILTEWGVIEEMDIDAVIALMGGKTILDMRNVWTNKIANKNLNYQQIG